MADFIQSVGRRRVATVNAGDPNAVLSAVNSANVVIKFTGSGTVRHEVNDTGVLARTASTVDDAYHSFVRNSKFVFTGAGSAEITVDLETA